MKKKSFIMKNEKKNLSRKFGHSYCINCIVRKMIKLYCNIKVLLQAIECRKVLYCKVRGVLQAGKAVSRYKNCIVTEMASFWLQYKRIVLWLAVGWLGAG